MHARDCKEAVRLYALAATQGHATAQRNLGCMHENGTVVAQNYHEAVRLYALAAAQGDATAQRNLGCMHEDGTGVAQNYHEAVRLYALAAAQGDALAQSSLRGMHAKGQGGLVRDFAKATTWLRLAAAQGHAHTQPLLDYIATSSHQPTRHARAGVWAHVCEWPGY